MREKFLRGEQMSDGSFTVGEASRWAAELTRLEARGPGDIPNAWQRLERRYGVPARTFWSLRYRPPKDLWASVYLRLRAAYEAELSRQIERLEHEIEITKAVAGTDHRDVVAAAAVASEAVAARAPRPRETNSAVGVPPQLVRGENGNGGSDGTGRTARATT